MAESTGITRSTSTVAATQTRQSYQAARGVQARAQLFSEPDSAAIRNAMERLRNRLASDEPFRTDAPRGYYFNIVV